MDKTIVDELPSNSPEAERGVLGCLLMSTDQRAIAQALGATWMVSPNDFYDLRYRSIFETIQAIALIGTPVEAISVANAMSGSRLLSIGGFAALDQMTDDVPSAANLQYYCDIVSEHAQRRAVGQGCTTVNQAVKEKLPMSEITPMIHSQIVSVSGVRRKRKERSIRDFVDAAIDRMEARRAGNGSLSTGYPDFDKALGGGFRPAEYVVLAGRPSMGKTSLAICIADHIAEAGKRVLMFSIESPGEEIVERLMSRRARISTHTMGHISEEEQERIGKSGGALKKTGWLLEDDSTLTMPQVTAIALKYHADAPLDLIVVDYLQLIGQGTGRPSEEEIRVAAVSMGLKSLAKQTNAPVLAVAQLNRNIETEGNRVPMLSDLRRSGQIEQDADVVAAVWGGPKPSNGDNGNGRPIDSPNRPVALRILKNRNGPRDLDIDLMFFGSTFRFESVARITREDVESLRRF